ncbi:MAG TPA: hypothetical protein VH700_16685 [Gemmatimonadales bacterium]|jgi:hypothetical protein
MTGTRLALGVTAVNLALLLAAFTRRPPAPTGPTVVRATAIELVDGSGRIRGRMNVEPEGAVVFRLIDQRGRIRVKLGADTDGSGLLLANDATEPGVHLLATSKGSSIRVVNGDGRERLIAP